MKWLQNFQSINVVVKQVYEEEECFFGQSATGSKENNLLLPGEKTEDVYIDPDDTVQFVRTKIETVCKVPVIYQCLFHKGICITHSFDTIIVREDELQLEKKIDIGDSRLVEKTTDFIGNVKTLHLYSLSGWVANNINRLYEMNNDDLDKLYNRFIKIYWPYCDNIKFKELVDGRVQAPIIYEIINPIQELKRITTKEINFKATTPVIIRQVYYSEYDSFLPLELIFDQLAHVCVAKFDENHIFAKVKNESQIANFRSMKIYDSCIIIPEHRVKIFRSGIIEYESEKIKHEVESLIEAKEIRRRSISKYTFNINTSFEINSFGQFVNRWRPTFERDVFSYTPVNSLILNYGQKRTSVGDEGLVTIRFDVSGLNTVSVSIDGITNEELVRYLYNIIVRMVFAFKQLRATNIKKEVNKTNVMNIDPILYKYSHKDYKPYSRLCQKSKQPFAFLDSDKKQLAALIKKHKLSDSNLLRQRNYTFPNEHTTYVCINKDYPYPTFMSPAYHVNRLCMVCCGKIDRSDTIVHKFCTGESEQYIETKQTQTTNLYYVRKYRSSKFLAKTKLSYLPDNLNKLLNNQCKIKNNAIVTGSTCYFLYGLGIIEKDMNMIINELATLANVKDCFIVHLQEKNGTIKIIETIDRFSAIEALKKKDTLFILQNDAGMFPVIKLHIPSPKQYELSFSHSPSSLISREFVEIFKLMLNDMPTKYNFPSIQDLIDKEVDFEQIIGKKRIVYEVIIKGIRFPIVPSLPTEKRNIVTHAPKLQPRREVLRLLDYLRKVFPSYNFKISTQLVNDDGQSIGFRLENKFIVFFRPEKVKGEYPEEIIHIDFSPERKIQPVLSRDFEQYNLFVLHFAWRLNQLDSKLKRPTINELKHAIGDMPFFARDLEYLSSRQYEKMEYFKTTKIKLLRILNNEEQVFDYISSLMKQEVVIDEAADKEQQLTKINIRTVCNQPMDKTLTAVCNDEGRMRITQAKFDRFVRLLHFELMHNEMRRWLIIENKLSRIKNPFKFSEIKNFSIIRIK